MKLNLTVEYARSRRGVPDKSAISKWARAALAGMRRSSVGVGVRIVGEGESAALNERYRHKGGPTNVLSFPFENPPGTRSDLLGDLVICAPVVRREARAQHIPERAYWAHMIVHGIMHLRGYDHETEDQATVMESMEARILRRLGFGDPYARPDQPLAP